MTIKKSVFTLKLSRFQIIAIALLLVVACGVAWTIVNNNDKPAAKREVIYSSRDDEDDDKDNLLAIPKDAKSKVCDAIKGDAITDIIKQDIASSRVSIANGSNKEGSVSGCTYVTADTVPRPIRSVAIVTREFNDIKQADSAYAILTKTKDSNRKTINDNAFYNQEASQLVAINGNKLHTVTLSRNTVQKVSRQTFEKLLKILP